MKEERRNEKWGIPFDRQNFLSNIISDLKKCPPAFDQAELWLFKDHATPTELSVAAFDYAGELLTKDSPRSVSFYDDDEPEGLSPLERPSRYLYDVIEFFLRHGLDPNFKTEDESLLHRICMISNDYIAADTLKLLLENGGDPCVLSGRRQLFSIVDSYVQTKVNSLTPEELNDPKVQSRIHCWLVLVGFLDGQASNSVNSLESRVRIKRTDGFHVAELKNHNNFGVGAVPSTEHINRFVLRIANKTTGEEVAVLS